MGKKDPRVDTYIAKAQPFARPILRKLRTLMHKADPKMEETLKWRMPSYTHDGIVCITASFKQHCALVFWKGRLIFGGEGRRGSAMGDFGRITRLDDLPSDARLVGYIKKAVKLNTEDVKAPARAKRKAAALRVPADLEALLRKHAKAAAGFKRLSTSHRNEYVAWITGAKRPETRTKRLATAAAWLAQGRNMNWRYER